MLPLVTLGTGAVAYAYLRKTAKTRSNEATTSLPASPRSSALDASRWLRQSLAPNAPGVGSPSVLSNAASDGPSSPGSVAGSDVLPTRLLEQGSVVVFFTAAGELVTAAGCGRSWELRAVALPERPRASEGAVRLAHFPGDAVFMVVRDGDRIGFRSLGAEGRILQAAREPGAPHRLAGHAFGAQEGWRTTPAGLLNCQWREKCLGLEVQEVRAVATPDIRAIERAQCRAARSSQAQVRQLQGRLAEADQRLRELLRASQRQLEAASAEAAELRARAAGERAVRAAAEASAAQRGRVLTQLEQRLGELAAEKDAAEAALARMSGRLDAAQEDAAKEAHRAASRTAELERQLQAARGQASELETAAVSYEEQRAELAAERDRLEEALQAIQMRMSALSVALPASPAGRQAQAPDPADEGTPAARDQGSRIKAAERLASSSAGQAGSGGKSMPFAPGAKVVADLRAAAAPASAAPRLPLSPLSAAPSPLGALLGPAPAPASAALYSLLQTASPRTSIDTPRILSPAQVLGRSALQAPDTGNNCAGSSATPTATSLTASAAPAWACAAAACAAEDTSPVSDITIGESLQATPAAATSSLSARSRQPRGSPLRRLRLSGSNENVVLASPSAGKAAPLVMSSVHV
ncbi:hypothetical protein WJX81_004314 [Elliptochloris bilobata]|uniref:Uncharacterized protein n=1 Tax=Elliptochloris bilobata TaxID=381761 RepID=A0AAW1RPQ5_9CHLO